MTKYMKFKAGAVALGLSAAAAVPAQADVFNVPDADWTGGLVTCRILTTIMEEEMGHKVRHITMPSGAGVYEGLRSGDLDFACEGWPSYSSSKEEYISEYGGDGSVIKFGNVGVVGASSYYVPRYLVEGDGAPAPDLKTLQDLNNYVDLFKALETGDKGRILGCPVAAWECDDTKRMEMLGVNFMAVELGSETAHWAEVQAAYARHEPIVAYAWEPHWIHAELDLVPLELPPYSDEAWPATGWPEDVTYNYGRPGMLTEHPDVAALIANSNLTNAMQATMIHAIDVEGRDVDEVVQEWLENNEDIWRARLPN